MEIKCSSKCIYWTAVRGTSIIFIVVEGLSPSAAWIFWFILTNQYADITTIADKYHIAGLHSVRATNKTEM